MSSQRMWTVPPRSTRIGGEGAQALQSDNSCECATIGYRGTCDGWSKLCNGLLLITYLCMQWSFGNNMIYINMIYQYDILIWYIMNLWCIYIYIYQWFIITNHQKGDVCSKPTAGHKRWECMLAMHVCVCVCEGVYTCLHQCIYASRDVCKCACKRESIVSISVCMHECIFMHV